MANIKSKKKPTIQKGNGYSYDPATFYAEHHMPNNILVDDPQVILDNLKPFEFMGRKFITFDTEAHAHYKTSKEVPKTVVRRWIGTGKKAVPIDLPFSLQIGDAENNYCIYDSYENRYKWIQALAPIFEDPTIEKIAHNCKFDMHMLHNIGMKIVGKLHDTVVLAKLVNENRTSFQLKDLAARVPGGVVKFEYMVDTYKQLNKVTDYRQIPKELLTEYGCVDVLNCKLVFLNEYTSMIEQDKASKPGQRIEDVYNNEMEVMVALYSMERRGMKTDAEYESELKNSLQDTVDAAEKSVYEMAGEVFNMNSNAQVYKVMKKLGVDDNILHFTDKGNVKLDKDEMARLDEIYNIPIISKILEYKKAEKLLTTYAVGIYGQVDEEGCAHGSINQTEATTGRMSITKPALQTLPKKDKRIRKMFVPNEDDFELWFMDLDQVEYRGFAHYAKAQGLIEAINNGYDVHTATAGIIYHIGLDVITAGLHEYDELQEKRKKITDPDELLIIDNRIEKLQDYVDARSKGKTTNFALVYGVGITHLGEMLRISETEATQVKANYFANIPEARPFLNTVYQVIKERGYVTNYYGRRRRLDTNDSYKAPNALIQGWAADYIKTKLVGIYKYLMYNNLKTFLVNIVHDELIENVHKDEKEHLPTLRWLLSDFDNFRCKITAGVEYGDPSWGQKKAPVDDIGFKEPEDMGYLNYNVFDGSVFNINAGGVWYPANVTKL